MASSYCFLPDIFRLMMSNPHTKVGVVLRGQGCPLLYFPITKGDDYSGSERPLNDSLDYNAQQLQLILAIFFLKHSIFN